MDARAYCRTGQGANPWNCPAPALRLKARGAPRAQVTTANLERVRKVKTRHQRLWTRVVTVREELQARARGGVVGPHQP